MLSAYTHSLSVTLIQRPGWNKGIDADTQLAMSLQVHKSRFLHIIYL